MAEFKAPAEPLLALVRALDGVYGFEDAKPVDTRNMGDGKHNDFPGLTYGDLRVAANLIEAQARRIEELTEAATLAIGGLCAAATGIANTLPKSAEAILAVVGELDALLSTPGAS